MTLNDLQDFRQRDLYAMLRLPDEEFQDRLVSMGLLNGSMDCTCGLPMKKKESSREVLEWQCNRAIHRRATQRRRPALAARRRPRPSGHRLTTSR